MSSHRQPSSGETAPRQRQLLPHADPVSPFHRLQPLQAVDNEQVAASPAEVRLPEGAAAGQAGAGEDPCAVEGADEAFPWEVLAHQVWRTGKPIRQHICRFEFGVPNV